MRTTLFFAFLAITVGSVQSCNWFSSPPPTFCDTACIKENIRFSGTHEDIPYVEISVANCLPDTLSWSYSGLGTKRKIGFAYLIGRTVKINNDFIKVQFKDNQYAWILFNDCVTGRGFQIQLPYDKATPFRLKSSGLNPLDPKFSIEEGLIANTDRGNLFVEDAMDGKKAMMTFGEKLDIDYDVIHDHIDSVSITRNKLWAKIKIGNKWVVKEKNITMQ
ncbi:MAG: hypothetical protein FJY16_07425 [Bacteroidetes bacterium]|nr:hypothetical protein [Bacteroidota bacterium]